MKQINTYINEKLRLTSKRQYTCQPEDKDELKRIIIKRIKNEGPQCDLNDIDTSKIKDMVGLFDADDNEIFADFNGDISQWDVSNVIDMHYMFVCCGKFNCDISQWNVSNVKNMKGMFYKCEKFNQDLDSWNVSNVNNMRSMFLRCKMFNQDLSGWDVSNVKNMCNMFRDCEKFKHNLDSWDVSNIEDMTLAFRFCPIKPKWYDIDKWG